jgi:hypothetical protein
VPVFNRFDGARDNVAKRLQAGGYHTGMIGKWHLGSDPTGFDRWIVLPGQGAYWNPGLPRPRPQAHHRGPLHRHHHRPRHRVAEDAAARQAVLPDAASQGAAPRLGTGRAEQGPVQGQGDSPSRTRFWDDYATRPAALPETSRPIARDLTRRDLKLEPPADLKGPARNQWLNVKPMEVDHHDGKTLTGKELVRWKYQRYMQDYLACVQGVDDGVGKVLDYLDQTGLAENTIVIYSADNGWYLGDLGLYDKRFMYEPGLRVPLLARGPGIPAGITPRSSWPTSTSRPPSSTSPDCPFPLPCRAARWSRCCAASRPPTGAPASTTATTTTPAITTPPPTSASAPPRTSSSITGRRTPTRCSTSPGSHRAAQPALRRGRGQKPEVAAKFAELKAEIARLQKSTRTTANTPIPPPGPPAAPMAPSTTSSPSARKTVAEGQRSAVPSAVSVQTD